MPKLSSLPLANQRENSNCQRVAWNIKYIEPQHFAPLSSLGSAENPDNKMTSTPLSVFSPASKFWNYARGLGNVMNFLITFVVSKSTTAIAGPSPYGPKLVKMAWDEKDIITRDICIIGGGSSGTYAAVRLRDMNHSVVVVERKNRLGGNTQTFTDPATQIKIDYGVQLFHNTSLVTNYFAQFGIPLTIADLTVPGVTTDNVDFYTGGVVKEYSPVDPTAALGAYAAQLVNYPYLDSGFQLPNPVPSDLLLPFGQFVTKYDIGSAVRIMFTFNEGIGDMLSVPTIYVMKLFGLTILGGIQNGFLTTASHDNSALYEKIQALLLSADALLLDAYIIAMDRTNTADGWVKIVVSTPSGLKLIKAKKVVLAIPPTLQNLANCDLDSAERSLFKQFATTGYYTGLLRNSGIPDNISVVNTGANTLYNLPVLPGIYSIDPTGVPGLHMFQYGSDTPLPVENVKEDILASIKRLRTAGTIATTTPEFAVFSAHTPFEFTVSAKAIKNGFYDKLNHIQSYRNTFYTGATFDNQDSSLLWQFTEAFLPLIVA